MRIINKKAFSIVELIIIIAVIAVLAIVLIPTFSNVIEKANESNDTSLVKDINTSLASSEIENGKPITMHETLKRVEKNGFTPSKLIPKSSGDIVWDQESNRFALVKDGTYVFKDNSTTTDIYKEQYKLWKIVYTEEEANNNNYSSYLGSGFTGKTLTVKTGVDSGEFDEELTISYTNKIARSDVRFRTKDCKLTINAINDTVKHFGNIDLLTIEAVSNESYHEYGRSGYVILTKGKFVAKEGSKINGIYLKDETNAAIEGVDLSKIITDEQEGIKLYALIYFSGLDRDEAYLIDSVETLENIRKQLTDLSNNYFADKTFKLTQDIDLTNISWEPIGSKTYPFAGSFDGANHTIKGLSNGNYNPDTSQNQDSAYGLFGVIGVPSGNGPETMTFKNLTLDSVNIDFNHRQIIGALIGADVRAIKNNDNNVINDDFESEIIINNIKVNGSINTNKGTTLGSAIGMLCSKGNITIESITNEATIKVSNDDEYETKAGGIIGYSNQDGTSGSLTISNCISNGNIIIESKTQNKFVITSGIISCYSTYSENYSDTSGKSNKLIITNCSFNSNIRIINDVKANEFYVSKISYNKEINENGPVGAHIWLIVDGKEKKEAIIWVKYKETDIWQYPK